MRRRGFLLSLGVVLALLLLAMGLVLSSRARMQLRFATQQVRLERAQAAADAGLTRGLEALRVSTAYTGNATRVPLAEGPETYSIAVVPAGGGLPDGLTVPTGCVYVIGYGQLSGVPVQSSGAMVKLAASGSTLTGLSGITAGSLSLNGGSWVDSYDSRKGGYFWGGTKGSVATNSIAGGSVRILGGSRIYGPVSVGKDGKVEPNQNTQYTVGTALTIWRDWGTGYGSAATMDQPIDLPEVDMPAVGTKDVTVNWSTKTLAPGAYADATFSNGAALTLQPGTYVFRSLRIDGGAAIDVTTSGPVKIYVQSSFEINNGSRFSTPATGAKWLQISLAKGATYTQAGGAQLTGVVYGPAATMNLSNAASIYGGVVGTSVIMNGAAQIHYDEALVDFSYGSSGSGTGSGGNSILFRQRF